MITRVVKMIIAPENIERFLYIFEVNNQMISNSKGCMEVRLFRDKADSLVFFTISKWRDTQDLDNYKQTVFFKSTWAKTKILFKDKPEAWSIVEQFQ